MTFRYVLTLCFSVSSVGATQAIPAAVSTQTPPPPATRREAFKPSAGSIVTVAYTEMGSVDGVSVDARELRDSRAGSVRRLLIDVRESEYRRERSFVDADEVPELLKG